MATIATTTFRRSGRLSTKVTVLYKEKKIPAKKARISKKVVKKEVVPAAAVEFEKVKIEKIKVEKIKVEKTKVEKIKVKTVKKEIKSISSANFDILKPNHLEDAINHMKKHDPKLAIQLDDAAIEAFKERLRRADGSNPFMSLARAIVYQQIHGKAAANIYARFLQLFDAPEEADIDWFPTPAQVLEKSVEDLRSAGLSGRKVEYIQNLATNFENKNITSELFDKMSDEEISTQLCAVKGIGQWTVDMFLMLDLHHPDVLPMGDLVVRRGIAEHFGIPLPSDKKNIFPLPHHMIELTEVWRPYRSLGSWLMWRISHTVIAGDT